MNRNKIVNLKVGITVIISILILLYGIAFLKDFKLNLNTNNLVVYFSDANGLKEGDQVGVNGVPKGKVKTIELYGDSVKVTFSISKDVVVKKDYYISIAMLELMSGKQILLRPGKSDTLADITKPLVGSKTADIVTLIETMNTVSDQILDISKKVTHTVDSVNVTINNVNSIIGNEQLKSDIKGTAMNFNTASRSLVGMLDENRKSLKTLTDRLNSIASNVDNTVTETKPEIQQTIQDFKTLTSRFDSVAINFNQILNNAKDTSSTVGKLLTDDKLYNNLNQTIKVMETLLIQIKEKGIRLRLF